MWPPLRGHPTFDDVVSAAGQTDAVLAVDEGRLEVVVERVNVVPAGGPPLLAHQTAALSLYLKMATVSGERGGYCKGVTGGSGDDGGPGPAVDEVLRRDFICS